MDIEVRMHVQIFLALTTTAGIVDMALGMVARSIENFGPINFVRPPDETSSRSSS